MSIDATKYWANYVFPFGVIVILGEGENGQLSIVHTIKDVFGYSREEVSELLSYNGWFPAEGDSYDWKSCSSVPEVDDTGLIRSWMGQWEAPVSPLTRPTQTTAMPGPHRGAGHGEGATRHDRHPAHHQPHPGRGGLVMTRIAVTDDAGGPDGWFDPDAATARTWAEGTRWVGNNHISLATGSQWDHEELWQTASGRWAVRWWSQWQGRAPRTRWVTAEQAQEWLVRNEWDDDAIADALGAAPAAESGPKGGRPVVGPAISVAYPADLLARIDAASSVLGITRAAWLRSVAEQALRKQQQDQQEEE